MPKILISVCLHSSIRISSNEIREGCIPAHHVLLNSFIDIANPHNCNSIHFRRRLRPVNILILITFFSSFFFFSVGDSYFKRSSYKIESNYTSIVESASAVYYTRSFIVTTFAAKSSFNISVSWGNGIAELRSILQQPRNTRDNDALLLPKMWCFFIMGISWNLKKRHNFLRSYGDDLRAKTWNMVGLIVPLLGIVSFLHGTTCISCFCFSIYVRICAIIGSQVWLQSFYTRYPYHPLVWKQLILLRRKRSSRILSMCSW